jgi:hypothetical protein
VRGRKRARVGPLAQAGLNEALGLAVGPRRVGPGAQMAQLQRAAGVAPGVAPIGRAVVGHDPLDRDALAGEPSDRALQERHRAGLAFIRQHFAVGQARGIVDADVHGLPAGATPAVPPVAGDPMADRHDPAELLGVDVDQLARPVALIAHDRRLGLERAQLAQPQTAQNAADRRDRHGKLTRDRRTAQTLPPPVLDLGHARGRHLVGTVLRRRAPVDQRRRAAVTIAREPAVSLSLRQSRSASGQSHRPILVRDPLHQ